MTQSQKWRQLDKSRPIKLPIGQTIRRLQIIDKYTYSFPAAIPCRATPTMTGLFKLAQKLWGILDVLFRGSTQYIPLTLKLINHNPEKRYIWSKWSRQVTENTSIGSVSIVETVMYNSEHLAKNYKNLNFLFTLCFSF